MSARTSERVATAANPHPSDAARNVTGPRPRAMPVDNEMPAPGTRRYASVSNTVGINAAGTAGKCRSKIHRHLHERASSVTPIERPLIGLARRADKLDGDPAVGGVRGGRPLDSSLPGRLGAAGSRRWWPPPLDRR